MENFIRLLKSYTFLILVLLFTKLPFFIIFYVEKSNSKKTKSKISFLKVLKAHKLGVFA
ncbi:hypothetical protein AMYT_2358 [Malaciobacter mytili LMG 24559]|nr:hypothetical protein AMYT_2358 [Malaciobacter mytili LMG 24559]